MVLTALLAGLLAAASGDAATAKTPDFDRFPASAAHVRRTAPIRLITRRDRRSRSALAAAARGDADFAGSWVLAQIGCGANCIQAAAVDKVSGRVVWFPATICCWPLQVSEPVDYRRGSRLLIVQGVLNETGAAASRAFLFDGANFRPLAN